MRTVSALSFACVFIGVAAASAYTGVENPSPLKCGVMSSTFAKAATGGDGLLLGSATDAFVKLRFPLKLEEKEVLARTKTLNLTCTKRLMSDFTKEGKPRSRQRLSCKSNDISPACKFLDVFRNDLEPDVWVYLDEGRVGERSINWAF
jgi:hypothetical protein